MNGTWRRILTVARREFLTTVRRRAFLLTLIGTPAYFAVVSMISAGAGARERTEALEQLRTLGVVDSSGLFATAERHIRTEVAAAELPGRRSRPRETLAFETDVRFYPDAPAALSAVRAGEVNQALVIPVDYLASGRVTRYARSNNLFSSADRRLVSGWLARGLVRDRLSPEFAARVARPAAKELLLTQNREGAFQVQDDTREVLDFLVPMFFSLLLGLSVIISGQYLLQGIAEEKESRILESLMCQLSPRELMSGKLFGLGAVGLLVIGTWVGVGVATTGPLLSALPVQLPAWLLLVAFGYFLLGYLFFGSLMTGIAAVTNNMREAQQFSVWFTFANFVPFIMVTSFLSRPNGTLPTLLSLFPPTAATAMMLRLSAPGSGVPGWQVGLSMALLAAAGWLTLVLMARVFRVGLLMYGKTPSLPEIARWMRRA